MTEVTIEFDKSVEYLKGNYRENGNKLLFCGHGTKLEAMPKASARMLLP